MNKKGTQEPRVCAYEKCSKTFIVQEDNPTQKYHCTKCWKLANERD